MMQSGRRGCGSPVRDGSLRDVYFFEDIINAIYSAILKPGDLAVDCGANCGLHTFPMSKLVGPSGKVVAVEAIPDVAAGLAQRGFPNIDVKATAIGAAAGRASFSVVRDDLGYSGLQQRRDLPGDLASSVDVIDVPVATLDSLLADRRQRVRFVKMDLEGGEFHALQGATSILRDRPLVIFENGRESAANCTAIRARIGSAFSTRRTSPCSICSAARFCRNDWHAGGLP